MSTLWYVTITSKIAPGKRKARCSSFVVLADNAQTAKDLARDEYLYDDDAKIDAEIWESNVVRINTRLVNG